MSKKVTIHWNIDGHVKGHGTPTSIEVALAWIVKMNKKYGEGTHWYE